MPAPAFPITSATPVAGASSLAIPGEQRLVSIDALRGFAMLWLIGGREILLAAVALFWPPWFDAIETQFTHARWEGFAFWDLVMPLFLFVVGVSMPLAIGRPGRLDVPLRAQYMRIARRVGILWILGMLLRAARPDNIGWELYSSALQAIAVGYLVTAMALLHLRVRGQIALLTTLLLGYAVLLLLVPFPNGSAGMLERRMNLPHYVDDLILGEFRADHSFTWIVTSLGFSATVLLGAMAGHLFQPTISARRRIAWLVAIGAACLTAGLVWSYWLPWNRHLWTSSMVLGAGGISFWLTALFYFVIDVRGDRRWAFPLVVLGANALLAYVVDPCVVLMSKSAVAGLFPDLPALKFDLLYPVVELAAIWSLVWYLYRKRIFLRA